MRSHKYFYVVFIWIGILSNLQATTYVSQHIDKDTKWLKINSPYIVTVDITIQSGATLEIEAGTKILFSKETQIVIAGNLIAKGSPSQKISFTGLGDSDWNGFYFSKECNDYNPSTQEGICFDYCVFKGTGNSPAHLIRSKGCDINLSNSTIESCYTAIQTERQAEMWISNSTFKNCNRVLNIRNTSLATVTNNKMIACNSILLGGTTTFKDNILKRFTARGRHSGIVVWMLGGGIVNISDNQFIKFEDYAIKLHKMSKRSSFLVHNNDFKHNKTNLKLSCQYYNKGNSTVENNNFYNCKQYHITLFAPCSDEAQDTLNIGSNYWGRLSNHEVKESILDHHQDKNITAKVQYDPILKKTTP
ncbi:right-handed parallel beta-helix repeat-containing protein [Aureispira anguillae]|uniref:Right-handed parallel beta-helix repeat-containing protein n=1 Tax=Aureispira anguillae TaxID=2864201 RepID=A0A916DTE3_9BACT|nr:right-handed parallel beta-helix repeat-containing protein [Aureispira anguillae]BDS13164.1 right-handed parallel beta-helix repeat-containing protein [Aureispira anguillae]